MPSPQPLLIAMSPVLAVDDLQVALDYYRDALGFEVTWRWGDPAFRAGIAQDGFELQLAAQYGPPGTSIVYLQVSRVDDYYQRCLDRGASIELELADRPWLMRDFRVLDPSGNKLGFGEPI